MLIRRPADIVPSEITPETIYRRRREFVQAAGVLALAGTGLSGAAHAQSDKLPAAAPVHKPSSG